jgi:hypothetical protein
MNSSTFRHLQPNRHSARLDAVEERSIEAHRGSNPDRPFLYLLSYPNSVPLKFHCYSFVKFGAVVYCDIGRRRENIPRDMSILLTISKGFRVLPHVCGQYGTTHSTLFAALEDRVIYLHTYRTKLFPSLSVSHTHTYKSP